MTLNELKTRLDSTGFPVAYYAFPEGSAPALPFICYLETGQRTFSADGGVMYSARQITIELYTESKDEVSEGKVETALSGIYYTKTETYLSDERCYETIYGIEV